jgi:hypothetical protein
MIQSKTSSSTTANNDKDDDKDNKDDDKDDDENDKKTETIVPSEKLEWSSDIHIAPLIDAFRKDTVWPHIAKEAEDNFAFVEYLDEQRKHPHSYIENVFKDQQVNRSSNNNHDDDNDE